MNYCSGGRKIGNKTIIVNRGLQRKSCWVGDGGVGETRWNPEHPLCTPMIVKQISILNRYLPLLSNSFHLLHLCIIKVDNI